MTIPSAQTTAPRAFDDLEPSLVADPALAAEGERRVAWARAHMPVLGRLRAEMERDRPLAGHRIGMCLHVEAKTAVLVETLLAGGAEIAWTGSPSTTDDGVAAAMTARAEPPDLRPQGGRHRGPPRAHRARPRERPGHAPRQRRRPHRRDGGGAASRVFAATEETTSGRLRLTRGAGRPRPVPRHRDQRLADQAARSRASAGSVRQRSTGSSGRPTRSSPARRSRSSASAGAGGASPGPCGRWARSCSSSRSTRSARSRRRTRGCSSRRSRRPPRAQTP